MFANGCRIYFHFQWLKFKSIVVDRSSDILSSPSIPFPSEIWILWSVIEITKNLCSNRRARFPQSPHLISCALAHQNFMFLDSSIDSKCLFAYILFSLACSLIFSLASRWRGLESRWNRNMSPDEYEISPTTNTTRRSQMIWSISQLKGKT